MSLTLPSFRDAIGKEFGELFNVPVGQVWRMRLQLFHFSFSMRLPAIP